MKKSFIVLCMILLLISVGTVQAELFLNQRSIPQDTLAPTYSTTQLNMLAQQSDRLLIGGSYFQWRTFVEKTNYNPQQITDPQKFRVEKKALQKQYPWLDQDINDKRVRSRAIYYPVIVHNQLYTDNPIRKNTYRPQSRYRTNSRIRWR